jgi:hypothetical protein
MSMLQQSERRRFMPAILVFALIVGFLIGTGEQGLWKGLGFGALIAVTLFGLLLFMWPPNLIVLRTTPWELPPALYLMPVAVGVGMAFASALPASNRLKRFIAGKRT